MWWNLQKLGSLKLEGLQKGHGLRLKSIPLNIALKNKQETNKSNIYYYANSSKIVMCIKYMMQWVIASIMFTFFMKNWTEL